MINLKDLRLTFVILDIIHSHDKSNWYSIEMRVPTHKRFSGFKSNSSGVVTYISVREVLTRLKQEGFVQSEGEGPMPTLTLTSEGRLLYDLMRKEHDI